jgi:hypothetical protein
MIRTSPAVSACALCLLLGASHARAGLIIYDNGAVNSLSTNHSTDDVLVRDSAPPGPSPTTLNLLPGGVVNNATVQGSSLLNLLGGVVKGTLSAYGSSAVVVNPGPSGNFTVNALFAHDSSTVTLNGPHSPLLTGSLSADGLANLHVLGAETGSVSAAGNSTVVIDALNLHNGPITATDNARLTVNSISGSLFNRAAFGGNSAVAWNHGAFGSMNVSGNADVALSGYVGIFPATLSVSDNGTLVIYGTGFNYADGELPVDAGTLTGTLADGTTVHFSFTGGQGIYLNVVTPAPPSLVLALTAGSVLGGWGLLRRRRCKPSVSGA